MMMMMMMMMMMIKQGPDFDHVRMYVRDNWLTACSSLPRKKVCLGELTVPQ